MRPTPGAVTRADRQREEFGREAARARGPRLAQEVDESSAGRLAHDRLPTPIFSSDVLGEILADQTEHRVHAYGQIIYEAIKLTHPRTAAELVGASYEYADIASITQGQRGPAGLRVLRLREYL